MMIAASGSAAPRNFSPARGTIFLSQRTRACLTHSTSPTSARSRASAVRRGARRRAGPAPSVRQPSRRAASPLPGSQAASASLHASPSMPRTVSRCRRAGPPDSATVRAPRARPSSHPRAFTGRAGTRRPPAAARPSSPQRRSADDHTRWVSVTGAMSARTGVLSTVRAPKEPGRRLSWSRHIRPTMRCRCPALTAFRFSGSVVRPGSPAPHRSGKARTDADSTVTARGGVAVTEPGRPRRTMAGSTASAGGAGARRRASAPPEAGPARTSPRLSPRPSAPPPAAGGTARPARAATCGAAPAPAGPPGSSFPPFRTLSLL